MDSDFWDGLEILKKYGGSHYQQKALAMFVELPVTRGEIAKHHREELSFFGLGVESGVTPRQSRIHLPHEHMRKETVLIACGLLLLQAAMSIIFGTIVIREWPFAGFVLYVAAVLAGIAAVFATETKQRYD